MSRRIDINCDLGEGMPNDQELMAYISSANIACGCHAGDADIMRKTLARCIQNGIAVGAHPSYADRANFGRKEMELPSEKLHDLIISQLEILNKCCLEMGGRLHHVKPHGALYNQSARNEEVAQTIAHAVKLFNPDLMLFGLAGSISIAAAAAEGLTTVHEFFADRTYQPNGQLTSRSEPNSMIDTPEQAVQQVLLIANEQTVITTSGTHFTAPNCLPLTICLHGDGKHAVSFATHIHAALLQAGFEIKAWK